MHCIVLPCNQPLKMFSRKNIQRLFIVYNEKAKEGTVYKASGFATKYVDRRCNFRKISAVAILPLKLARVDKYKFSWFNKFLPMSGLWLRFNFIWLTITLFGYAWKTLASIWNLCGLKPLVSQEKCGRNILISKQSRSRTQTNTWTNTYTCTSKCADP